MKKTPQKHKRTKREHPADIVETKDFAAKVTMNLDGEYGLEWLSPAWFAHQISKFKVGDRVTVFVSNRKPKRSLAQNAYYWGAFLPLIAAETGENDIERLHRLFTGKFLTEGIVDVLGQKVRMVKSTATLSKMDFSEYIRKIEGETGIAAPPTQNYWDD